MWLEDKVQLSAILRPNDSSHRRNKLVSILRSLGQHFWQPRMRGARAQNVNAKVPKILETLL